MTVSMGHPCTVPNSDPNPRGMIPCKILAPILAPHQWSRGAMWIARRCVSTIVFLPFFLYPPLAVVGVEGFSCLSK